ncbi:hypothetical protein D3C71_2246580 [compost metagenome]
MGYARWAAGFLFRPGWDMSLSLITVVGIEDRYDLRVDDLKLLTYTVSHPVLSDLSIYP